MVKLELFINEEKTKATLKLIGGGTTEIESIESTDELGLRYLITEAIIKEQPDFLKFVSEKDTTLIRFLYLRNVFYSEKDGKLQY